MYARALVNPFGDFPELPCIPDSLILPSQKVKCFAKGTFATGINGCGFISVNPFLMITKGGVINPPGGAVNATYPILFTTTAYPYTDYNYPNGGTLETGVTFAESTSIFDATSFDNSIKQYRLVGCGISIRYVGSTFQNQGLVTLVRSPGNQTIPDGYTEQQLNAIQSSIQLPLSRGREVVTYIPDAPQLLGYSPKSDYDATLFPNNAVQRRSLLIFISGGSTTTPQRWQYEVVAYYEVIGPDFTLSASHADPIGAPVMQASLPIQIPSEAPQKVENTLLQATVQAIGETVSAIAPPLLGAMGRYGTQLAVKALGGTYQPLTNLSAPQRLALM
jgi:hypothetical protein